MVISLIINLFLSPLLFPLISLPHIFFGERGGVTMPFAYTPIRTVTIILHQNLPMQAYWIQNMWSIPDSCDNNHKMQYKLTTKCHQFKLISTILIIHSMAHHGNHIHCTVVPCSSTAYGTITWPQIKINFTYESIYKRKFLHKFSTVFCQSKLK